MEKEGEGEEDTENAGEEEEWVEVGADVAVRAGKGSFIQPGGLQGLAKRLSGDRAKEDVDEDKEEVGERGKDGCDERGGEMESNLEGPEFVLDMKLVVLIRSASLEARAFANAALLSTHT